LWQFLCKKCDSCVVLHITEYLFLFISTLECDIGNTIGLVCYVPIFPVHALTFESQHDLETSFWYVSTSSKHLEQVCISRSSGQGHGHESKKQYIRALWTYIHSRVVRLRLQVKILFLLAARHTRRRTYVLPRILSFFLLLFFAVYLRARWTELNRIRPHGRK